MTTIDTLRMELADDPEGIGYASMSDPQAADAINACNRPTRGTVLASDVRRFVLLNGIWPRIASAAQSSPDPTVQGTAVTILQTLAPNSFDEIRMGDPAVFAAVSQMLDTMVTAGIMTDAQRIAMIALGDTHTSRAAELGLPNIHHLDVAESRLG
jgi:hypothetical protein